MFCCSGLHHFHHWFNLRSGGKHTVFPSVKVISDCFSPPVSEPLSPAMSHDYLAKDLCRKNVHNHSPQIITRRIFWLMVSALWKRLCVSIHLRHTKKKNTLSFSVSGLFGPISILPLMDCGTFPQSSQDLRTSGAWRLPRRLFRALYTRFL